MLAQMESEGVEKKLTSGTIYNVAIGECKDVRNFRLKFKIFLFPTYTAFTACII